MVALTFFGEERFDVHHVHPHESPAVMTTPLFVLAGLSHQFLNVMYDGQGIYRLFPIIFVFVPG